MQSESFQEAKTEEKIEIEELVMVLITFSININMEKEFQGGLIFIRHHSNQVNQIKWFEG